MTVGESVSNHDSTTGDHFLWVAHWSHRGSTVHQNWQSVGGIKFSENRNPCLTCIRSTKKQQEVIEKMGEDIKPTRTFEQDR